MGIISETIIRIPLNNQHNGKYEFFFAVAQLSLLDRHGIYYIDIFIVHTYFPYLAGMHSPDFETINNSIIGDLIHVDAVVIVKLEFYVTKVYSHSGSYLLKPNLLPST